MNLKNVMELFLKVMFVLKAMLNIWKLNKELGS